MWYNLWRSRGVGPWYGNVLINGFFRNRLVLDFGADFNHYLTDIFTKKNIVCICDYIYWIFKA